MPEPLIYLNGQFLSAGRGMLPFHDAGLVMGATVTDLCRTFRGKLYRWTDHLARFRNSCAYCRIDPGRTDADITTAALQLADHNAGLLGEGQELALVLLATPGLIGYYGGDPGGPGDAPPTLAMHTLPLPFARYRRLHKEGAHLVVPSTRHLPASCVDPRAKQRSRMHWWLADRQARDIDPVAQALLVNEEGLVTETAAANFLIVKAGRVLSPPSRTILGGISLQVVREMCPALRIPFEELPLSLDQCLSADEAFLTSTPYCLAGVSRINNRPIPWPGPVTMKLLAAWSAAVGVDIRIQIMEG